MKKIIAVILFLFFSLQTFVAYSKVKVLTQDAVSRWTGTCVVNYDYDLKGAEVILPENVVIKIENGRFANGALLGNNTRIDANGKKDFFGTDLIIGGTWIVDDIYDEWFAFDSDSAFVSNKVIENILALASDSQNNHIHLLADRTYFFELPYKGRADLGNVVYNYTNSKGEKKRRYFDLYTDDFAYLRIFTIPSNTHLTVCNKLQMLPTNQGVYYIFWEYNKHDVTIDGNGVIAGDVLKHKYTDAFAGSKYFGEWGFVFCCQKCRNFTFKDITIRDAFGDCIIYRGSAYDNETGQRWASDLLVDNVKIINARRNGIAVAARNVVIRDSYFEGCGQKLIKGVNPRSAVDFETDNLSKYPELGNQNVVLENCIFKNNVLDIASVHNNEKSFGKMATIVKDCVFTAPLKINTTHWLKFVNCKIPALHNTVEEETKSLYCSNIVFDNCTFTHFNKSVLVTAKSKKIQFNKCKY